MDEKEVMSIFEASLELQGLVLKFLADLDQEPTSLSFFSKYSLCIDHRKASIKEETFPDEEGWLYIDDNDMMYCLFRMDYLVTKSIWEGLSWLPNSKNISKIAETFQIAEIKEK